MNTHTHTHTHTHAAGQLMTVFSAPDYPQFMSAYETRYYNKVSAICCTNHAHMPRQAALCRSLSACSPAMLNVAIKKKL